MPGKGGPLSRRDFIRILAAGAGAAALWNLDFRHAGGSRVVRESRFHMGTIINLTLVGDDEEHAQAVMAAVFGRIEALESVMSRFRPGSDVSRLNREGFVAAPHPDFVRVLRHAASVSALTRGAFDITVMPLIAACEGGRARGQGLPGPDAVAQLRQLVDWRKLCIGDGSIRFESPGMGASLDGIAKGYIVDEAVRLIREAGYSNVLMEAGGDLLALGESGRNAPWKIGVRPPRPEMQDFVRRLELVDRAVATSGDYLQPYSDDYRHHHIFDPRTGYSPAQLASATVAAPTCWQADAIATALMVMDLEEGLALVRQSTDLEAILVTKDLRIVSAMRA